MDDSGLLAKGPARRWNACTLDPKHKAGKREREEKEREATQASLAQCEQLFLQREQVAQHAPLLERRAGEQKVEGPSDEDKDAATQAIKVAQPDPHSLAAQMQNERDK